MYKDIKGYENKYQIDEYGNVRSLLTNKILKPWISRGYKFISLMEDDGSVHKYTVHRLVAENWVPNPEGKPVVMHKNNNKLDTYYKNLSWGTVQENTRDALRDGLLKIPKDRENSLRASKIASGEIVLDYHLTFEDGSEQYVCSRKGALNSIGCGQTIFKDFIKGRKTTPIRGKNKTCIKAEEYELRPKSFFSWNF